MYAITCHDALPLQPFNHQMIQSLQCALFGLVMLECVRNCDLTSSKIDLNNIGSVFYSHFGVNIHTTVRICIYIVLNLTMAHAFDGKQETLFIITNCHVFFGWVAVKFGTFWLWRHFLKSMNLEPLNSCRQNKWKSQSYFFVASFQSFFVYSFEGNYLISALDTGFTFVHSCSCL